MSYEAEIEKEVSRWPDAAVAFQNGSKHRRAVLTYAGKSRFVVYPSTSGDTIRGAKNCLNDVRRELASLGANKTVNTTRDGKRKVPANARRHERDVFRHIEKAPVKPNPFDALLSIKFATPEIKPDSTPLTFWQRVVRWFRALLSQDIGEA